jgi:hypothetical protein
MGVMQTIVETEEKPLGVIESLQRGFNFLNRHLWLILLPIFLDAFLWLGPRLSVSTLIDRFVETISDQPDLPQEFAANFTLAAESLKNLGANYNFLSLLAGPLTGLPSLFARLDFPALSSSSGQVIDLTTWQAALMWAVVLIPIGILIGSFWLTHVVFSLRRERFLSRAFLGRWGWVWLNINLYFVVLFVSIILLSLLMGAIGSVFMVIFGSIGAALFSILWVLFIGFSIWLSIGLYFVVTAIALDGVNLASAVWRSLNVVGRNALSTLGFLILVMLLTQGFARIWVQLSSQTWGVILSILGNAYLGSAIIAASFLFYQSRYHYWQKTRALVMLNQRPEQNDKS